MPMPYRRDNRRRFRYNRHHDDRQHNNKLRSKFFTSKVGLSILWLVITSVVALFAGLFPTSVTNILAPLFWAGTFIIGVYFAYKSGMFVDRKFSYANTGLFARKMISGAMSAFGLIFTFGFYFSFAMIWMFAGTNYGMLAGNIMVLGLGFFVGMIFMGAYIFFTYQRGSGIIIHHG